MSSDLSISGTTPNPSTQARGTAAAAPTASGSAADQTRDVAPEQRVEQAQQLQDLSKEKMERLVEEISKFAANLSRNLDFSVDDPTGHTVITVTEKESGELIRKIPSEEFLKLSQHIQDMNSLLFQEKV